MKLFTYVSGHKNETVCILIIEKKNTRVLLLFVFQMKLKSVVMTKQEKLLEEKVL